MSVSIQHSVYPQKPCRTFEDWYQRIHFKRTASKGRTMFVSPVWDETNPLQEVQKKWTAMKIEAELEKVEDAKPSNLKGLKAVLKKLGVHITSGN